VGLVEQAAAPTSKARKSHSAADFPKPRSLAYDRREYSVAVQGFADTDFPLYSVAFAQKAVAVVPPDLYLDSRHACQD